MVLLDSSAYFLDPLSHDYLFLYFSLAIANRNLKGRL